MIRFIFRLSAVVVLAVLWIVGVLAWNIRKHGAQINEAYRIGPTQDILFIGSSDVGCSIVESPEFHNRVLWQSSTVPQSCLFRLQELERRGQLKGVKTLIMYFNIHVLRQLKDVDVARAYYQEFPLSWRHLGVFPGSRWTILRHICDNLQYPIDMAVVHQPPKNRPSIVSKGRNYYEWFCADVTNRVPKIGLDSLCRGWHESVLDAFGQISQIARCHSIRFVVVEYPVLSCYRASVPAEITQANEQVLTELEQSGIEVLRLKETLPDEFYCDADHIVDDAACKYTAWLYRELGM